MVRLVFSGEMLVLDDLGESVDAIVKDLKEYGVTVKDVRIEAPLPKPPPVRRHRPNAWYRWSS